RSSDLLAATARSGRLRSSTASGHTGWGVFSRGERGCVSAPSSPGAYATGIARSLALDPVGRRGERLGGCLPADRARLAQKRWAKVEAGSSEKSFGRCRFDRPGQFAIAARYPLAGGATSS